MKLQKNSSLSLLSPAKINLFFLILNKRSDSFHEIASLYQAINIFDELTIEISDVDKFTCSDKSLENTPNTVLMALNLFRRQFQIDTKVKIHLKKNIPIQSGLGGGSSNAATVLWALNQLIGFKKNEVTLIELSKKIGADVPFFFSKGSAICTGIGDIVQDVDIPNIEGWVLKPYFKISTPSVYANVDNSYSSLDVQKLLSDFSLKNFTFINDLQNPAAKVDARILDIQKHYPEASMTGSGSCFFSLKKPNKSHLIEKIIPFKGVLRRASGWYSINQ